MCCFMMGLRLELLREGAITRSHDNTIAGLLQEGFVLESLAFDFSVAIHLIRVSGGSHNVFLDSSFF